MKAQELCKQVKGLADELSLKVYAPSTIAPGYRASMSRLMQANMLLVAHSVATGANKAEVLKALDLFAAAESEPMFVIIHTHFGNDLTRPMTLDEVNNGSQAYPAHKANALKVGQTLDSSFKDERAIKRVS
jgi:hypothetical protein